MSNPKRVLHCGMSSNIGGIEIFIMNLYRQIDRSKIQFDFLAFSENIAFEDEIASLGGRIYKLTPRKENLFKNYHDVNTFFSNHKEYTIVHFHFNTCSYITHLLAASKNVNTKIIAHGHSQWRGTNLRVKLLHEINKIRVGKRSTQLFACSDSAGKYMFGSKIINNKEKYKVLKNSIDANNFRFDPKNRETMRSELNINDKFVVGHIGRLNFSKNHEFLLDIFYQVHKQNKNSILVLVGAGELEEKIKEKIVTLGLENCIKMLGTRKDVANILQSMDVFLFPSLFEGFGTAALEAQAAGLKVIVADTVPSDIKVTDNLEFIPLTKSVHFWAERVLSYDNGFKRQDTYNDIVESGHDIVKNIEWLEEYYVNEI